MATAAATTATHQRRRTLEVALSIYKYEVEGHFGCAFYK